MARIIVLAAAVVAVGGLVLFQMTSRSTAPAARAPAQASAQSAGGAPAAPTVAADWKSKGNPSAPVVVEEWGDFQ